MNKTPNLYYNHTYMHNMPHGASRRILAHLTFGIADGLALRYLMVLRGSVTSATAAAVRCCAPLCFLAWVCQSVGLSHGHGSQELDLLLLRLIRSCILDNTASDLARKPLILSGTYSKFAFCFLFFESWGF